MTANGKLALKAVSAFCAALLLGRLILPTLNSQPRRDAPDPGTGAVDANRAQAVAAPSVASVSSARADAALAMKKALLKSDLQAKLPVEQNFKTVDGGVLNDNKHMKHFLSAQYAEGTLHQIPHGFGESVRWVPKAEEVRAAHQEIVAVVGGAAAVRGSLEAGGAHNRMVYRNTYPDTEEHMYVRPDGGIEHDILLSRLPSGVDGVRDLAYSGYLELGRGLTLWDGGKQITGQYRTRNGVQVKNYYKNTVFVLPAPVAYDAAVAKDDGTLDKQKQAKNEFIRRLTPCEYQFDFDESGIKMAVVTPGKWLASAERAFPVVIDPRFGPFGLADGNPPSYVASVGTDTLIPADSSGTKVNYGALTNLGVRTIAIPFPFTYCAQVFNRINLHIDGYADFQTPPAADSNANTALPAFDLSMYVYWSNLQFSNDPNSGVYFFTDGVAPNRRFIVEWSKMTVLSAGSNLNNINNFNPFNPFFNTTNTGNVGNATNNPLSNGGSTQSTISFNLILYECDSKFEYIIGGSGDTDSGFATVGEQCNQNQFIQYDFDSALGNGTVDQTTGQVTANPPITPGTALTFGLSALGTLAVTPASATGCIPLDVCFTAMVTPPKSNCADNQNATESVGFHWVFGDGTEAFTPNVCHQFIAPGAYQTVLTITDSQNVSATNPAIPVNVCDVPRLIVDAEPQGGTVPLDVSLGVTIGTSNTLATTGPPTWYVDLLNSNGPLGQGTRVVSTSGNPIQIRLDQPGFYKVTVIQNGSDSISGLDTSGTGYTFLYTVAPNAAIVDPLIITSSQFNIDWVGKQPRNDAAAGLTNLPPSNPNGDTLSMNGFIPLPGVDNTSQLLGKEVQIILNGSQTIFDGILDANGHATFGTQEKPAVASGDFQIDLPSGAFSMACQGDLFVALGLFDATDKRLIPAQFKILIQDLYPPPGDNGAFITYDYHSNGFTIGPPPTGSAVGVYNFGNHTKDAVLAGFVGIKQQPAGLRRPGGRTLLVSGAFVVKSALLTLTGNTVVAKIQGMLGRYGGDGLRPTAQSDVVVSLGNFSDVLNFTTTPTFKTSGKNPKQVFSFKRSKSLAATGVASLSWANQPGNFQVTTFGIPNDGPLGVGLNPALGLQTVTFGLTITPDSGAVFNAVAHFDVVKTSETTFVHGLSKKK